MSANAVATLAYARWLYGTPAAGPLVAGGLRALAVAVAAVVATGFATQAGSAGGWAGFWDLLFRGGLYAVVTAGLGWIFGGPVLRDILAKLAARIPKLVSRKRMP